MRRIGSNIRKQKDDARANRIVQNIVLYTDDEKPRNDYPRKIVSPVRQGECCRDENRELVGSAKEVDGFKFCYKICTECGHAVKFYFPAMGGGNKAVKEYREWKRYMVQ